MLILASTSPWRLNMLRSAGIPIEGIAPPINEYEIRLEGAEVRELRQMDFPHIPSKDLSHPPMALALARAREKARSVAMLHPEAWVIGADQVCWASAKAHHPSTSWEATGIFEKPSSPDEHLRQLKYLRDVGTHTLTTGVSLFAPHRECALLCHSHITFHPDLSDAELAAYVQSGEGAACAGGYQAEARGALLIAEIAGDWNNVIGLPLFPLVSLLRQEGWISPLTALDPTIARHAAAT